MQVYLAGEHEVKNGSCCSSWKGLNILESFYYARKKGEMTSSCLTGLFKTDAALRNEFLSLIK